MIRLLYTLHVGPLVQLFAFDLCMSERGTRKDLFVRWEDLVDEPVVAGLALEKFRGKLYRVAAAAMQQDYCMRMGVA